MKQLALNGNMIKMVAPVRPSLKHTYPLIPMEEYIQWEEWTGMRLPSSGSYIIEGGLVPLQIDKETNTGIYIEPNVWRSHTL